MATKTMSGERGDRKRRDRRSRKKRLAIGTLEIGAAAIAVFLVVSSPIAMGDPAFHRGIHHPALRLFGDRYEVAYQCPKGASRLAGRAGATSAALAYDGARHYHYLAWNNDDAIRFSASVEPDCRIARLILVKRRWFRRYPDRLPVIGPAEQ